MNGDDSKLSSEVGKALIKAHQHYILNLQKDMVSDNENLVTLFEAEIQKVLESDFDIFVKGREIINELEQAKDLLTVTLLFLGSLVEKEKLENLQDFMKTLEMQMPLIENHFSLSKKYFLALIEEAENVYQGTDITQVFEDSSFFTKFLQNHFVTRGQAEIFLESDCGTSLSIMESFSNVSKIASSFGISNSEIDGKIGGFPVEIVIESVTMRRIFFHKLFGEIWG